MIAYFTGVWPGSGAGHYCVHPGKQSPRLRRPVPVPSPWALAGDAVWMPLGDSEPCNAAWSKDERQPEGIGRHVVQDGWTLLHFWDRSEDTRHGCHASFAFDVETDPEGAVALVRQHFPAVLERIEKHIGRPVRVERRPEPA